MTTGQDDRLGTWIVDEVLGQGIGKQGVLAGQQEALLGRREDNLDGIDVLEYSLNVSSSRNKPLKLSFIEDRTMCRVTYMSE